MVSGDATGLGRALLDLQEDDADDEVLAQTIKDVFASKSTATLRGRSGALAMFGRWSAARRGLDSVPIFPLSEKEVYEYLCELRREKAPQSRAPAFLEAVAFSKGLLGYWGLPG